MKYVLDTSVALKWVLPESDSDRADHLRDEFRNAIHDLIAPDVFPAEVAHALTRAERRGLISPGQASILFADIMHTSPQLHSYLPLVNRAITISSAERIGVYDCVYVAMAEREACEFITADNKLVKTLTPRFPFMLTLAHLP